MAVLTKLKGIDRFIALRIEMTYKFVKIIQTYSIEPNPIKCIPNDPHITTFK